MCRRKRFSFLASAILTSLLPVAPIPTQADLVINEIFYNAPNDLDALEYVELFNSGTDPVNLSGWKFSKAITFTFPNDNRIEPGGFVVVCKKQDLFAKFYPGVETRGEFTKSLGNSGDKINLSNAEGNLVDSVSYKDRTPWPVSPDGYSASLERISPTEASNISANWAPSSLSDDYSVKPSGSPGKANTVHAKTLPPVITDVSQPVKSVILPQTAFSIEATVANASNVNLLYRVVAPGSPGEEIRLAMNNDSGNRYSASIPGQEPDRIIRYRVEASGESAAKRFYPHPNEIRPALSVYVTPRIETGKIPVAHFFSIGTDEFKRAEEYRRNSGRGRGGYGGDGGFRGRPEISAEEMARMEAERFLRDDTLASIWNKLTLSGDLPTGKRNEILPAFRETNNGLVTLREQLRDAKNPQKFANDIPEMITQLGNDLRKATTDVLDSSQREAVAVFGATDGGDDDRGRRGFDRGSILQQFLDIERSWFGVSMNGDANAATLDKIHGVFLAAIKRRDATKLEGEDGRPDFDVIREELDTQQERMKSDLVANIGAELVASYQLVPENPFAGMRRGDGRGRGGDRGGSRGGRRGFSRGGSPDVPLRPQGLSAFIYTDPANDETQLFDFVNITQRKSGYKVRLHKDRPLRGMTSINVLYEPGERTILNEALSYDLYRAAGNASQRSGYVRVVMNGNLVGYHLWFEQPNGAFFRHNKINENGNLYKLIWMGGQGPTEYTPEDKLPEKRDDVVGRHEKKTNPHDGYDDLIDLVEALDSAGDDDAMWQLIQKHFDVDQVINYFAVNSLISHWDGFFNNYFLYHDTKRKKWTMYPWDQDSTWSQRGGDPSELYRMPLNFGAEGATPDGETEQNEGRRRRGGFGRGGFGWWREGGEISKPLLANPQFLERFKTRLKELADTVFTEDIFGKKIEALESDLEQEVMLRAKENGRSPESAAEEFKRTMDSLRQHLIERRKFVLDELNE